MLIDLLLLSPLIWSVLQNVSVSCQIAHVIVRVYCSQKLIPEKGYVLTRLITCVYVFFGKTGWNLLYISILHQSPNGITRMLQFFNTSPVYIYSVLYSGIIISDNMPQLAIFKFQIFLSVEVLFIWFKFRYWLEKFQIQFFIYEALY